MTKSSRQRRVWVARNPGSSTSVMVGPDDLFDDLRAAAVARFPTSLSGVDLADILIVYYYDDPSTPNTQRSVVFREHLNVFRTLDQWFPNGYLHNDILYLTLDLFLQKLSPAKSDNLSTPSHNHLSSTIHMPYPVPASILPVAFHNSLYPTSDLPLADKTTLKYSRSSQNPVLSTSPTPSDVPRTLQPGSHARQNSLPPLNPASQSRVPLQINSAASPSPKTVLDRILLPVLDRSKRNSLPLLEYPHGLLLGGNSHSSSLEESNNLNFLAVLLLPKNFSLSAGSGQNDSKSPLPLGSHKKQVSLDDNVVGHARQRREKESRDVEIPKSPITAPEVDEKPIQPSNPSTSLHLIKKSDDQAAPSRPSSSARVKSKPRVPSMRSATTDKVLPSISVLVVEDNAINQAILGAFLRKHKILYQIAKNGQEAVDKWRLGRFHLVLMDIQLPVKLGIEATKEIRNLEKANHIGVFTESEFADMNQVSESEKLDTGLFRLPVIIVALTASLNSLVDKKNALMAGCNDFLTKPVNLVWLQNKITEWGCMQALIDFDGWKSRGKIAQAPMAPKKAVSSKG